MKTNLTDFTGKYQLSKTLRFELKPVGKTLEHIQAKGLISEDEKRAESYQKMKKTIDGFHKYFIELAMNTVKLTKLEAFQELFNASPERKKEESYKKELEKVQDSLRKEIVKGFSTGEAKEIFNEIFKEDLIKKLLGEWLDKQEETAEYNIRETKEIIKDFKNFTTYFGGFHENRKNMYSDKAQSTAIAFRLIHENLPKFLENIKIFEKVKAVPEVYEKCQTLYKEIEEYLNINAIDEAFELEYYNEVLTQKQIDVYNLIIGGRTASEGKTKIQGLNEYINLYNQKQEKNKRIPKLKILYKQILSDRVSTSFTIDKFTKDQEVLDAIENYYKFELLAYQPKDKEDAENVLEEIKKLLAHLADYDLGKIYLRNDTKITNISQKIFGNYGVFNTALEYYYATEVKPDFQKEYEKANQKKRESLDKAQGNFVKQSYLSIELLQKAIDAFIAIIDKEEEICKRYSPTCIADYFRDYFKAEKEEGKDKEFGLIVNISNKYSCIQGLLETDYPEDKKLVQQKEELFNIKAFLDSLMELLHFVKPLSLPNDSILEKDQNFYGQFDPWMEQLNGLIPLYNKVRNYATQKPYSEEKFKLNFENKGQFLGGWVDSHTENSDNATQAGGYLFRKKNNIGEYDYFLGVSADSKLFRSHLQNEIVDNDKSEYERLDYYQLKSASVYGNSYIGEQSYDKDRENLFDSIIEFVNGNNIAAKEDFDKYISSQKDGNKPTPNGLIKILQEKHSKTLEELMTDDNFIKENEIVTNNLKNTILSLNRIPKSQEYKDTVFTLFTEPIQVIEDLSKEKLFSYFPVSAKEFEGALNRKLNPLLLFKISSRDLSYADSFSQGKRKSRGRENIHTLYFRQLMSGNQNLLDIGTGEVFFRESSIKEPTIHKAKESIANKNPLTKKQDSTFEYDIIKDRRFTIDKFQFHLSIIMNYQKPKKAKDFDLEVIKYLQSNPDVNIIGLDRGERHLIYLTLINQKGEIILQESLNNITAENHPITTPYHELLDKKEKERDEARKSWGTIENIKELKEGYISQVVHKIAKLMVQYNAIVVMEDLNFGFKRGRFKVEKQVYQKLEKMLIDKLNYLVFKDKASKEPGGLYNALQLTNKFTSFKEMGKQSGFLFYVPAWNTSKIDPTTGFVNLFDTRYENIDKAKTFFLKFEDIRFNPVDKYFEFVVENYSDFNAKAEGTRQDWTICSFGERIKTFRNPDANNQWDNKVIQLTEEWKALFEKYKIDYKTELKEQILQQTEAGFFKAALDLFKLTLQMRNSITNSEVDYLISPVKNKQGQFFDSRQADDTQPKDADANGAYHIAKKGLMWLAQINSFNGTDWKKLELDKSNKGWLQFIQNKN